MARHPGAARADGPVEPIYPTEDELGEESLQRFVAELLRPLIAAYLHERGLLAFTGADQFVYYKRGDAFSRVAPDVFVLPGVRPGRRIKSWKVWETGIAPSLAIEIVSDDVDKDYLDGPPKYDSVGVQELIVFDPDYEQSPERVLFQVFRRLPRRGLTRVEATNADRVRSKVLGCHLRTVGVGEDLRLRLSTGPTGDELFPTPEEAARRERAGRLAAEAEVERLRAALAKLGPSSTARRRTKRR